MSEEDVIAIYRATVRALYAYVSRRVGGDVGLAEDLVQETWIRALNDWSRKGPPDHPLAWLMRVVRNPLSATCEFGGQRPSTWNLSTSRMSASYRPRPIPRPPSDGGVTTPDSTRPSVWLMDLAETTYQLQGLEAEVAKADVDVQIRRTSAAPDAFEP